MKNCQEISGLYEQGKLSRISISDKIALRSHNLICKQCRQYFKDSDLMDVLIARKFKDLGTYTFSESEKAKMKEELEKH
jgi:hypothetical protein